MMQKQAVKLKGRRLLVLLMTICIIFSSMPVEIAKADKIQKNTVENINENTAGDKTQPEVNKVYLLVDGQEISSAALPTDKHLNLQADFNGEAGNYSWQILLPEDNHWVDISGADEPSLQVGCGIVMNALNEDNIAYVRCRVEQLGESFYSAQLQIHLIPAEPEETSQKDASGEMVVLSDEQILQDGESVTVSMESGTATMTAPARSDTAAASPVKSDTAVASPAKSDTAAVSPVESDTAAASPAKSDTAAASPVESDTAAALPAKSDTAAASPAEDDTAAVSPAESDTATASPAESDIAAASDSSAASAGDSAGGELITHYITVEYVDKNGTPVYSGFRAQVTHNTEFTATAVVFPTILGYTPYFTAVNGIKDGEKVTQATAGATEAYKKGDESVYGIQKNEMEIAVANVTEDIHYQVVYYPNKVNYTVTHYVQNIIGEDYVLWGVETKTGYVDEMTDATDLVNEQNKDHSLYLGAGYIALVPFANVKIAADGTTQVNTYYDRMYFLMRFKLGEGGRNVSPIYAQYGSPVVVPDPERTGYTFSGWDSLKMEEQDNGVKVPTVDSDGNFIVENTNVTLPETMPAENTAFQARWEAADTSYTVVYWLQEAPMYLDDIGKEMSYAYWASTTLNAKSGEIINKEDVKDPLQYGLLGTVTTIQGKQGKEFAHYYFDHFSNEEKTVEVAPDGSTIVNVYYNRKEYNFRFFYGREKDGVSQIYNGYTNEFSNTYKTDNCNELLNKMTNWADMASGQSLTPGVQGSIVTLNNGIRHDTIQLDGYTYHYLTFSAVYGQRVTDLWPNSCLKDTEIKVKQRYMRVTPQSLNELNGKSFALVSVSFSSHYIGNTVSGNGIVRNKNFDANSSTQVTEWTFIKAGSGYRLRNGNNYMVMNGQGYMSLTTNENSATIFHVTQTEDGIVKFESGGRWINAWEGQNGNRYQGYEYDDAGGRFYLYALDDTKKMPFSAWTGEYWLKYERDEAKKQANGEKYNYTIKGLYAQVDEKMIYDASYGEGYADKGTEEDYLDFFTYWQITTGSQYLFYLWTEMTESDGADLNRAINQFYNVTKDNTTQEQVFHVTPETEATKDNPATIYKDSNGKYYKLARIIQTYDDANNSPVSQTYPAIVGYTFRNEILNQNTTWTNGTYFFDNPDGRIQGYTYCRSLNFMYDANNYKLELYSGGKQIKNLTAHFGDRVEDLLNKDGADGYHYLDAEWMEANCYPDSLPKDAYTFGGWYKSSTFQQPIDTSETATYPAKDMIIRARWVPKKFDVNIYQTSEKNKLVYYGEYDSESMRWTGEAGLDYGTHLPGTVPVEGPDTRVLKNCSPKDSEGGTGDIRVNWVFQCYAYMKEGVEHAVDVNTFTVTEDVDIYAKWSATSIVNYKINYVLADLTAETSDVGGKTTVTIKDGNGNNLSFTGSGELVYDDGSKWEPTARKDDTGNTVSIASSLEGKQNQGANRTFTAKTGKEMNTGYEKGYYPLTASHTLLMEAEDAENGEDPLVEYTFYYVKMDKVPYTVNYLNSNRNPIADPKDAATELAVVTENFKIVNNYTADAFQKSLVLSANPAENIINFYYTSGSASTFTVSHYFQTLGNNYEETFNNKNYTFYMSRSDTVEREEAINFANRAVTGYEYVYYTVQHIDEAGNVYYVDKDGNETDALSEPQIEDRQTLHLTADFYIYDVSSGGEPYTVEIEDKSIKVTKDGQTFRPNEKTFYYDYNGARWKIQNMKLNTEGTEAEVTIAPTSVDVPAGKYGTQIKVYYDLKKYPYTVNHWIRSAGKEDMHIASENEYGVFQSQVTGTSWTKQKLIEEGYAGYRVDKDEKQITITRNIQDDSQNPTINVINFYYYETDMRYSYQPMVVTEPGEEGILRKVAKLNGDPNAHVTVESETIKAVNGTASASSAVWNDEAYNFAGWYLDEECTKPAWTFGAGICELTGTENVTLRPKKITTVAYKDDSGAPASKPCVGGIYAGDYNIETGDYAEEKTFYALFEPKLGSLTINRTNPGPGCGHNEANSFVYHVLQTKDSEGSEPTNPIGMYVTIDPGKESVTISNLPFGTYQVTQESSWSWRYSDPAAEVTISNQTPYPPVEFSQSISNKSWLSGYDTKENIYESK